MTAEVDVLGLIPKSGKIVLAFFDKGIFSNNYEI